MLTKFISVIASCNMGQKHNPYSKTYL